MSESGYDAKPKRPSASATKKPATPAPKPKRHATTAGSFSKHAAAPPSFDFGKVAPGTHRTLSLPLHNMSPTPVASVRVSYEGAPCIQLLTSPPRLGAAGERLTEAQNIELVFHAPATRGSHHGTLSIDLMWIIGGPAPESLRVPVVGHSMTEGDETADERRTSEKRKHDEERAAANEAEQLADARREQVAFDAKHPGFSNSGFNDELQYLYTAVDELGMLQTSGLLAAQDEVMKYKRAPPPKAEPSLMFELAMLVLDVASASVAGGIAKRLEASLRRAVSDVAVTIDGELTRSTIAGAGKAIGALSDLSHLGAPQVAMITDAVKEALKGSGKLARKRLAGGAGSASKPLDGHPPPTVSDSADPRIAFFQAARDGNIVTAADRKRGFIAGAALLRPTLHKDPTRAIKSIQDVTRAIRAEAVAASNTYAHEAVRQWINFIARPQLALNKVASPGDRGIGDARGVLDIGFEAGRSPAEPVIVRSAVIRGISNSAARRFQTQPLVDAGIPIRAYGLPSAREAELLVTVLRSANGDIDFLDRTHGAAPGPGRWLANKGNGDALAGARQLIEREILGRSMQEHHVTITTDQDPAVEQDAR